MHIFSCKGCWEGSYYNYIIIVVVVVVVVVVVSSTQFLIMIIFCAPICYVGVQLHVMNEN